MSIRNKVTTSLRWMAITKILAQIMTWAITLIIIRILSPEDYGLMSMAMLVISFTAYFNEMGFGSALVQRKEINKKIVSQVFGLLLTINIVMYLLVFLSAPFVAEFFNDDRLTIMIQILGLQVIISAFLVIPDSMLTREMNFKKISIVEFISSITASLTTLFFALKGAGVWSLVYGNLIATVIRTVGMNYMARYFYMPKLSFNGMREIMSFGGFLTIDRMLWFIYTQADIFIIGKLLGKEILGYYTVANQLASLPMQKFRAIIGEVGFSAFSTIQDDKDKIRKHLSKAVRLVSAVFFPIFIGLSSVADNLVNLLLGDKWVHVIIPLQILSLIMGLRMTTLVQPVLHAIGRPDVGVKILVFACVIIPTSILIGSQWGLLGISMAWLVAYPIQFYITLRLSLPLIDMKISEYVGQIMPTMLISLAMFGFVFGAKYIMPNYYAGTFIELVICIVVGVVSYAGLIFMIKRSLVDELISFARKND